MNDSKSRLNWNLLRKGWTIGLIAVSVGVIVVFLAPRVNLSLTIAFTAIFAVGWILVRFAHASRAGVILWGISASMMTLFCWYLENNPRVGFLIPIDQFGLLLSFIGFVSMIAGMVVFLVAASKARRGRAVNCAGCMLILFIWLTFGGAAAEIINRLECQNRVENTTHTIIKLHQLAAEIEAFRERLGRLPDDEEELVQLRGQPMPTYYKDYCIRSALSEKRPS